ncbi:MAG: hypothetical protein HY951_13600 [Bacteroidia bacterium]|nr:hypothetical protein [Bacteroidia bacterium]
MRYTAIRISGLISIFLLIFTYSCGIDGFSGKLDEGVIEYDMVYLQDEKDNPLISLLPTSMTVKFKDDVTVQKIEGWMGIFQMAGIADRDKNKRQALLKIMNEKYYYETTMDGPQFGYDEMPGMKVEKSDSTKTIAGYKCKAYSVSLNDSANTKFIVYYTDEIKINKPNCNNPFNMIDGVLLEYQMAFQKIPTHLKAKKVIKEKVNDEEFAIPEGFVKVPKEKMQETISNLM